MMSAAKAAYEEFVRDDYQSIPWSALPETVKQLWERIVRAAVNCLIEPVKTPEEPKRMSTVPNRVPTALPRGITFDPLDSRLTHGVDEKPTEQAEVYLVLSDDERASGFIRPVRTKYVHTGGCGVETAISRKIAETYAKKPDYYGSTYCTGCNMHRPVSEFEWNDHTIVGS